MWGLTLPDIVALLSAILTLVVLEGLLSADNALVLAVMVRHLPRDAQKLALRYGIIGAFVFRLIAVILAASLLSYWYLKVFGGAYLLFLSISHLLAPKDSEGESKPRFGQGFWATVAAVELADIAFSIDSILAAVGMAEKLPANLKAMTLINLPALGIEIGLKLSVVYIGGILGIITMRYVAGYFIILIDRFHGLATGAYLLVGWIGLDLIGGGLHNAIHPVVDPTPADWQSRLPAWLHDAPLEMPTWLFWGGMGLILVLSMLYNPKQPKRQEEELGRIDKEIQFAMDGIEVPEAKVALTEPSQTKPDA